MSTVAADDDGITDLPCWDKNSSAASPNFRMAKLSAVLAKAGLKAEEMEDAHANEAQYRMQRRLSPTHPVIVERVRGHTLLQGTRAVHTGRSQVRCCQQLPLNDAIQGWTCSECSVLCSPS